MHSKDSNYFARDSYNSTISARGKEETTEYWAYGEPAYDIFTEKLSEENVKTSQVVDVYGSVTAITQEDTTNAAVTLTEYRAYDSKKRLCKISSTDAGTALFEYNTLGQMTAKSEGEAVGTLTDQGVRDLENKLTHFSMSIFYMVVYVNSGRPQSFLDAPFLAHDRRKLVGCQRFID